MAVAMAMASCDGTDYSANLCTKLDDCNALEAGMSVSDCNDNLTRALDDMSSGRRNDCERQIATCLDKASCDNFLSCDIADCDF